MREFLKTAGAALIGCLAALGIFFFLSLVIILSIAAVGSQDSMVIVPKSAILKIDFSQPVGERSVDDPFSDLTSLSFKPAEKTLGILQAVQAVDKAAYDPAIKFLYMNLSTMNIGMSQLEELRDAIGRFRKSGKAVIAYATNYSQGAYYMASVADKIYMQKDGRSMIFGIGTNIMFFKDLLNRLGIEVQLIRHGKFKAAAEQFVAANISVENRTQNQTLIDSIWKTWIQAISDRRGIPAETFNSMVDNLELSSAESLLENNLIDEAVTLPQMTDKICSLFGVEKEKDLKIISLADYAKATVIPDMKIKEKVAVIYADGEIAMKGEKGITAAEFCPMISKIKGDSTIKAVVLRINSPGGDAQAAEMINNELQLLRKDKPVIVSFGDYAASGGYWIAAQADMILTNNTTITGSIGVFSLMMNYGKGLKKHLDVNVAQIGTNKHSNMLSGINPLNKEEQEYMQSFVEDIYSDFTNVVADGRELSIEYVDEIAQGRIWSGLDAINLKLADCRGGIADALACASLHAGLGSNYRVVEYPVVKTPFDKLLDMLGGTSVSTELLPEPFRSFGEIYGELTKEQGLKSYARIPYLYEFSY